MGEHITQNTPQTQPYSSGDTVSGFDMIWVWNTEKGKLERANIAQLPLGSGGGGGGAVTHLASPFNVTLESDQVSIIDGNTVIADVRLLEKSDYPVNSTQLNNSVFRENEITYDPLEGKVTILDFILQSGEVVTLYPAGVPTVTPGGNLQPILDRLVALEAIVAPFIPTTGGANYARVWWTGGIDTIPEGWVEDTTWRDYTPIHASNPDQIGLPTGSNAHTLTSNQLGSFQVSGTNDRTAGTSRNTGWYNFNFIGGGQTVTLNSMPSGGNWPKPTPAVRVRLDAATNSFSLVQKSKYGIWIKYVGA